MKIIPPIILIIYALLSYGNMDYLDTDLNYINVPIGYAPEDILGFGFEIKFIFFGLMFLISFIIICLIQQKINFIYWGVMLLIFGFISTFDFVTYSALRDQVIKIT